MLIGNLFVALFKSHSFFSMVFPFLYEEYFVEKQHAILFRKIKEYNDKYNRLPNINDIKLMIETDTNISESDSEEVYLFIKTLKSTDLVADEEMLVKEVEKFCQTRALEIAILDSVEIMQNKKEPVGKIEEKIKQALAVEFDSRIGHDYINDAANRLKWYYDNEENIPLDVDLLNGAMGGGLKRKAIFTFMSPPKRGKSLFLCHSAASLIRSGQNVLYLTCELSEKMISKRIDANLLDIEMRNLNVTLNKDLFKNNFKKLVSKTHGELIVKEYAPRTMSAKHIRHLLNDLKRKKNFVPDVIIVDYINICASSTLNASHMGNSNLYIGSIVLELRGVAVDFNLAVLSAIQTNRGGVKKSTDVGMDDMADAFSIAMNVDWCGAIIQSDELRDMRKYLIKTVLTRFDENANDVCTIGVDYQKMRLLNLEESEQEIPQHIKDKLKSEKEQQREQSNFEAFDFS